LAALDARVEDALRESLAENTWRAYAADWRRWSTWAGEHDLDAMPAAPLDLARYLVDQAAHLTIGTLTRRLSAISKAHLLAGHADPGDDPAVREVLRGLRRQHGTTGRGAPPLWTSDIERLIAATHVVPNRSWGDGQGTAEVRDRALLLLAFTSALRRSELAALDLADLEADPAGMVVHVRRSKTDQTSEGDYVGIPYAGRPGLCAVRAVQAWTTRLSELVAADAAPMAGPLFRPVDSRGRLGSLGAARLGPDARISPGAVRDALVRRTTAAGLTPAHGDRGYTAHSTRAGFATQAAANGASERAIMDQGRWKSLAVARSYIRRGSVFTDNAAGRLGL
jgi:integrase